MTLTVERPDLSRRDARRAISKSFLQTADLCGNKAWLSLHDPQPFIGNERVTFGSALDAAVEQTVTALRAGMPTNIAKAQEAAAFVIERDDQPVDLDEVMTAVHAFERDLAPHHDFAFCLTQHTIRVELEGIGPVEGHPDLILKGIYDVKSAGKAKAADAAATSYTELGLYALMREAETGIPVPEVGYWTWVRSKRPYWQEIIAPVTDAMRRISHARAAAYVRALEADAVLNDGARVPVNGTFPSGPKWAGMCNDCPYAPWNTGTCAIAGEAIDVAA